MQQLMATQQQFSLMGKQVLVKPIQWLGNNKFLIEKSTKEMIKKVSFQGQSITYGAVSSNIKTSILSRQVTQKFTTNKLKIS